MPPRPRPPRPRPAASRRPRVAGMAPTAARPAERVEEPAELTVAAPERGAAKPARPKPTPAGERAEREAPTEEKQAKPRRKPRGKPARREEAEPAADGTERLPVVAEEADEPETSTETRDASAGEEAPEAAPGRGARLVALVRRRAVPLLAVAALVLTTVAVVAGVQDARLRGAPSAANTALVDVGATAEVAAQLSDAVETVYSFDFARLDENERAAREVITPAFAAEFDRLFAEVRARAPEQQAVVSATVTHTAVKEITGDRAVVVAFVDQLATRAAPDAESQQLAAAGRLTVTGERVDGRWKIAAVTPL